MSGEIIYDNELITRMLQEAFTFEGKLNSAEFTRFKEGFIWTVNECARDLGYKNRDEMIYKLTNAENDELLRQIQIINDQLKEKSRKQMARIVDYYYNSANKDQPMRSLTQVLLQKLRKGIATAENEVSRLIAEILYGIVTLATLRI